MELVKDFERESVYDKKITVEMTVLELMVAKIALGKLCSFDAKERLKLEGNYNGEINKKINSDFLIESYTSLERIENNILKGGRK